MHQPAHGTSQEDCGSQKYISKTLLSLVSTSMFEFIHHGAINFKTLPLTTRETNQRYLRTKSLKQQCTLNLEQGTHHQLKTQPPVFVRHSMQDKIGCWWQPPATAVVVQVFNQSNINCFCKVQGYFPFSQIRYYFLTAKISITRS